jgi:asparagine synthase (glutamine-hydrolysing)
MSAISGLWCLTGRINTVQSCRRLMAAQRRYGRHDEADKSLAGVAFGRNLHRTLPEDLFDRQPVSGGNGRFLLVADIRIDNRDELVRTLGLGGSVADLSDCALLMKAFEAFGDDVLDRISGDYAFALWDDRDQRLLLARDPTGQRPLHYHKGKDFIAFASMPRALFSLVDVPAELDERRLAELVADLRPPADGTHYKHVSRVPTGHVLIATRAGLNLRRYWNPQLRHMRLRSQSDYVDAFRERVDHAVRARLRGSDGTVASHLSAGVDSGTVTATAANLLAASGGRVLAFTSAPRADYAGDVPRGRVADETPYAAHTAALYSNVEHIVLRSDGTSPLSLLDRQHQDAQYPVGQLSNNIWWTAINREAARRGARVLLTGQLGNHALSAAGLGLLADLVRERQWRQWWREARLNVNKSPARWQGVLANSFGPWLPKRLWILANGLFAGASTKLLTPYLLAPAWAARIDNSSNPGRDTLPPKDSYAIRRRLLQSVDPGTSRKASLAGFGMDERDPTADRQLIEFCLALPFDQMLKDGVTRPLARLALADRLPSLTLNNAPRGYQMADWHEALRLEEVRSEVDRIAESPMAASIISVPRLRQMIEAWPTKGWNSPRVVMEYRFHFLIALSVAHFIRSFSEMSFASSGDEQGLHGAVL